jgi:hypothetical protein
MRWLSITALTVACMTSSAAAEPARPTASLSVSARVVSYCELDLRTPTAALYAPRDLRCSEATPARVEVGPVHELASSADAGSFVLTTINF